MLKKTTQWNLSVEQLFLACSTIDLFIAEFNPKFINSLKKHN